MTNGSFFVVNVVSIFLSGVSIDACIIALGVLLYYKMWRSFIYRLMLYMFATLIFSSSSTITLMISYLRISNEELVWKEVVNWTNKTGVYASLVIPSILIFNCLAIVQLLVTSITVCIYLTAFHNYQFTYKSDLYLLVSTIIFVTVVSTLNISASVPPDRYSNNFNQFKGITIAAFVLVCLLLPVNIVFTALTLVPLCCRACGYNLCMKTAATIESHRKAMKEVLPFFILIVPSILFFLSHLKRSLDYSETSYNVVHVIYSIPGLVSSLTFALHLHFMRKKLKKLQGSRLVNYESVNFSRIHCTTVFASDRISDSCITNSPLLSAEDTQYLLTRNSRVQ